MSPGWRPLGTAVVAALTALAALAVAPPAGAAPAPWKRLRYDYHLDGVTRGWIEYIGTVRTDGRPAYVAWVDTLRGVDGRPNGAGIGYVADFGGGRGKLRTWGDTLGSRDLCSPPNDCRLSKDGNTFTFHQTFSIANHTPVRVTDHIVAEGTSIDIRVVRRSGPWRIGKPRTGGFARLTDADAAADGADINGTSYAVNRGGSLPGGPRGSVLVYDPGCVQDGMHRNDTGGGAAVITGATEPIHVTCPVTDWITAAATRTTWTVHSGTVTATTARTRLVVIDA